MYIFVFIIGIKLFTMIKQFVLLCTMSCAFLLTEAQPPSSEKIMSDAYASAKKESKNIIVIFHASWCGWCHKMDRSMEDPSCKKFFDNNYITVHMVVDESRDKKDLENPGASEFRDTYFGKGQGLPYWLVFDQDGHILADSKMRKAGEAAEAGDNTGCPASKEEVAHFITVLRRTSDLKDDELEIIEKRFRQNEN
jgi:thioredoxin-related protein